MTVAARCRFAIGLFHVLGCSYRRNMHEFSNSFVSHDVCLMGSRAQTRWTRFGLYYMRLDSYSGIALSAARGPASQERRLLHPEAGLSADACGCAVCSCLRVRHHNSCVHVQLYRLYHSIPITRLHSLHVQL